MMSLNHCLLANYALVLYLLSDFSRFISIFSHLSQPLWVCDLFGGSEKSRLFWLVDHRCITNSLSMDCTVMAVTITNKHEIGITCSMQASTYVIYMYRIVMHVLLCIYTSSGVDWLYRMIR